MTIGHKLSIKDEKPTVDQKKHRSMIGGLQYLTHTRLDIENAVGIVARFQANPKEYTKGLQDLGLTMEENFIVKYAQDGVVLGWVTSREVPMLHLYEHHLDPMSG